ncbi:hypothetical protein P9112_005199 [Eukaryota sp. TZLM1-RC]
MVLRITISRTFFCTTTVLLFVLSTSLISYGVSPFNLFFLQPESWQDPLHLPRFIRYCIVQAIHISPLIFFSLKDIPLQSRPQSLLLPLLFRVVLYLSLKDLPLQAKLFASSISVNLFFLSLIPSLFTFHFDDLSQHASYLHKTPSILLAAIVTIFRYYNLAGLVLNSPWITSSLIGHLIFDLFLSGVYIVRFLYILGEFGFAFSRFSHIFAEFRQKLFLFMDFTTLILIQISTIYFAFLFFKPSALKELVIIVNICYFLFNIFPLSKQSQKAIRNILTSVTINRQLLQSVTRVDTSSFASDDVCVLCRDPLSSQQVVKLPCQHFLHKSCFIQMSRSRRTCPICNFHLDRSIDPNVIARMVEMFPRVSRSDLIETLHSSNSVQEAIDLLLVMNSSSPEPSNPNPDPNPNPNASSRSSSESSVESTEVRSDDVAIRGDDVAVFSSQFHEDASQRQSSLEQRMQQMRDFARQKFSERYQ